MEVRVFHWKQNKLVVFQVVLGFPVDCGKIISSRASVLGLDCTHIVIMVITAGV